MNKTDLAHKITDRAAERSPRLGDEDISPQVNLLVLDGPAKPLYEHVVPPGLDGIRVDIALGGQLSQRLLTLYGS
jgi:hypothetical protein